MDQCVDIYGIDGSILNSVDMEFYYPGQHLTNPIAGKESYKVEDITRMMEDLEEHSILRNQSLDSKEILTEKITGLQD